MNWFHNLMIALILFIGMLGYMAIRSSRTQLDLVTEKYYEEEIKYQDRIDNTANNDKLKDKIQIDVVNKQLQIIFPSEINQAAVNGRVKFYFAADKNRDKEFALQLNDKHLQEIPLDKINGNYSVQIEWTYNNKSFYTEKKLFL